MTGVVRTERPAAWEPARYTEPTGSGRRWRWLGWIPLILVLAAETYLSARLIHVSLISPDESLYIYSGRQLIDELLHGGGSPYYETYFSGVPDLYPILAAAADAVGGLVAARLMSLAFMLVATTLLFLTGRRLFGYWPGIVAAALFAGLGITQGLGALATFDAMSLMMIAAAAYCGVRAAERGHRAARWLLLVPLALLAANALKYASLIFDPAVIGLAALRLEPQGWRRVAHRVAALGAATALILLVSALLAGGAFIAGIMYTTLNRPSGVQPAFAVLKTVGAAALIRESWSYLGAVIALGLLAVPIALVFRDERRKVYCLILLVLSGCLVTLEAIRLRTDLSMSKHDDFGAWFVCIAAGYALARLAHITSLRYIKVPVIALSIAAVVLSGNRYSDKTLVGDQSASWSALLPAYADLRPYLELPSGRYLLGTQVATQIIVTDNPSIPWYRYADDLYIKYPIPGRGGDASGSVLGKACMAIKKGCVYLEGPAGYRSAISAHWFSLISMIGNVHTGQDAAIMAAVRSTRGYVLLTTAGGAPTWIYAPDYKDK